MKLRGFNCNNRLPFRLLRRHFSILSWETYYSFCAPYFRKSMPFCPLQLTELSHLFLLPLEAIGELVLFRLSFVLWHS